MNSLICYKLKYRKTFKQNKKKYSKNCKIYVIAQNKIINAQRKNVPFEMDCKSQA